LPAPLSDLLLHAAQPKAAMTTRSAAQGVFRKRMAAA
jgi:hypothetical protein